MNPLIGLQTGWTPNNPLVTAGQGMPQGLMGNVLQQPQTVPSLMNTTPGDWSQVAYNMAGRPIQGPYPTVATPPMPAGVTNGTQSSGGSSIGGTALGILGALAKNPSLLKTAGNAVSSLFGGGSGAAAGSIGSIMAGGSPALSAVGTGAVAPAVDSASADAAAALGGTDAAAGAAGGGLLGAGAGAVGPAGASSLAASGGFATGGAAGAGGGGAAAGIGAGIAAPLAVAGLVGLIGSGAISDKANDAGNAAMSQWMKASGATFKPNYTNSGQNTFGTNNGLMNASSNPGTWYDKSGQPMSPKQVAAAITAWGKANGINTGNINYSAGP